jgi:ribosomal protein S18 acetylase RimI-like enzyme
MDLVIPVPLQLKIRLAAESDLEKLEWLGMYSKDREMIKRSYQRQLRDENLMLVAELNRFPIAQAWIDLEAKRSSRIGVIWAVRVFPFLRGMGLGGCLISIAEQMLTQRKFRFSELSVHKENKGAQRLYRRLGYVPAGRENGLRLLQKQLLPRGKRAERLTAVTDAYSFPSVHAREVSVEEGALT